MITNEAQAAHAELLTELATLDTMARAMRELSSDAGTRGTFYYVRQALWQRLSDLLGADRARTVLGDVDAMAEYRGLERSEYPVSDAMAVMSVTGLPAWLAHNRMTAERVQSMADAAAGIRDCADCGARVRHTAIGAAVRHRVPAGSECVAGAIRAAQLRRAGR